MKVEYIERKNTGILGTEKVRIDGVTTVVVDIPREIINSIGTPSATLNIEIKSENLLMETENSIRRFYPKYTGSIELTKVSQFS